jgi:hypothetical protein
MSYSIGSVSESEADEPKDDEYYNYQDYELLFSVKKVIDNQHGH